MGAHRSVHALDRWLVAVALALPLATSGTPATSLAAGPTVTRLPYLTDSAADHVTVNLATSMSVPMPEVTWGPAGGTCADMTKVADRRTTITVGGTTEYQFSIRVSGLAPDTAYCYRVRQGTAYVDAGPMSFRSGIAAGASTPYSFVVLGDSGGGSGGNFPTDEANIMSLIAASGARLLVNAGDIANGSGDQGNYGDLTHGGSFIFGPAYWPMFGGTLPAFVAPGNHGSMNVAVTNWAQPGVVAESGGTYSSAGEWYAFDFGMARFYILTAVGTGSDTNARYKNDYDTHWAPGAAERQWLANDLAAHRDTALKFAVFHYPLYTDNNTEKTDPWLDGSANLEGLLAANGVSIVFNGHAHIYERNRPQISGSPMVSYVNGASAAYPTEPINKCFLYDAYAIGWSSSGGSSYNAPRPATRANFFSFLVVSVNGTSVTVTPTDSTGRTFDVQTYTFGGSPPPPPPPPPTTGSVAGTVTDTSTGVGLAGAAVGDGTARTTTGTGGSYRLDGLAPGDHSITASMPGYGSATATAAIVAGATTTLNVALSPVAPPPHSPVFSDGFESGSLAAWTTYGGMSVEGTDRHAGLFGLQGNTTAGRTYAKKLLPSTYIDGYARTWFDLVSAGGSVNVLRLRTATDGSLGYVTVDAAGRLTFHSDVSGSTTTASVAKVSMGAWHELELHSVIAGSTSRIEVWLDGASVPELTTTLNLGTTAIGKVQIGEVNGTGTWNVLWDDIVFDTQRAR